MATNEGFIEIQVNLSDLESTSSYNLNMVECLGDELYFLVSRLDDDDDLDDDDREETSSYNLNMVECLGNELYFLVSRLDDDDDDHCDEDQHDPFNLDWVTRLSNDHREENQHDPFDLDWVTCLFNALYLIIDDQHNSNTNIVQGSYTGGEGKNSINDGSTIYLPSEIIPTEPVLNVDDSCLTKEKKELLDGTEEYYDHYIDIEEEEDEDDNYWYKVPKFKKGKHRSRAWFTKRKNPTIWN